MELERYLVELERPRGGWGTLPTVAAGAKEAAAELRRAGVPVRFLRSVFVPEDDACFFLFEGPSREAVRRAAERVAGVAAHVVERVAAPADVPADRGRKA